MKFFIPIVLIVLVSCTNRSKKSKQPIVNEKERKKNYITSKVDFKEFLETIPELELPIKKMCYDDFTCKSVEKKFADQLAEMVTE